MQDLVQVNTPTASISGTTSTANAAYPANSANSSRIWVYNSGSVVVFVKSGNSSVTAAATDTPIPPAQARFLAKDPKDTHLAGITATSTATIYFQSTPGA